MTDLPEPTKERRRQLWLDAGWEKGSEPRRFAAAADRLVDQVESLTVEELFWMQTVTTDREGEHGIPFSIAQFMAALAESKEAGSILNLSAGIGLQAALLSRANSVNRIDAVSTHPLVESVGRRFGNGKVQAHTSPATLDAASLTGEYDAVIACPPVGMQRERLTLEVGTQSIELQDSRENLLVAVAAPLVAPTGVLAVVVRPDFVRQIGKKTVWKNLDKLGLHLSALITIRPGVFMAHSATFNIAVFERSSRERLFVAEMPSTLDAQKELLGRLWERAAGRSAAQGRLVDAEDFSGLAALEAGERVARLARSGGLEPVPFGDAVLEIRKPYRRGREFEHCDEHPDAVYLPEMARTAATTRQDDLPERLKSYYQLIVNRDRVLPEFLAEQLNTPLGHALRESAMSGNTIPRIVRSNLEQVSLFLPPVPDQRRAVAAAATIKSLRNELSELEERLWERPRHVGRIEQALSNVNHEDRFQDWVEALPFPLASILRSYHAIDRTEREKYDRLLHFFEATAAFLAAIHISAFRTNTGIWQRERERLSRIIQQQHLTFDHVSFGLWRIVVGRLAAELRSMLGGDSNSAEIAIGMYEATDRTTLEMLSSKALSSLLDTTNTRRNRWSGHGGVPTEGEARERHTELRGLLEELRSVFGRHFLQYQLIEPQDAEILDGPTFRCRVRRVMGSNPQLEQDTVTITTPAKTGSLYLHSPGHDRALELMPFVQLRDAPQPAGYFYNRVEDAELRLVSYSFADASEVSSPGGALLELFDDFRPSDDPPEAGK